MIFIWSRWGILVLPFVGIGVLIGYLLSSAINPELRSGPGVGVFIGVGLMLAAVILYFVVRATVGKVIDKPRQIVVWQQLAEPVVDENGNRQTQRAVPVTDPATGAPLWQQPTSSFFFIPVKYWPFVLGGIGALVFVVNLFVLLASGG